MSYNPYLDEDAQDAIFDALKEGKNVSISYDDNDDEITIDTTGLNEEEVEDVVNNLLSSDASINISYDDSADKITISVEGTTKTLKLMAEDMWGSLTEGATGPEQEEFSTNKVNLKEMRFSDSDTSHAEISEVMPDNWDGGAITARFFWRGSGSGSVRWRVEGQSYGEGDKIDRAWGSGETVDDDASAGENKSDVTSDLVLEGTPEGGELAHFRVSREGDNAADDFVGYAHLHAVQLEYEEERYSH